MIYSVYAIEWTEYERGWGQRPDGVSLHKSKEIAEQYIKDFIEKEKERNPSGAVPDEYTSPDTPRLIEVDKKVYDEVQKKKTIWK